MATTKVLNEQLLQTMKALQIPQSLQHTILNLSPSQKQSMLDLYSRQTILRKKRILSSNDPLDKQLLNRMNELSVPKHIQSQILTLPREKKQILFEKYNSREPNTHTRNNTIINESHTSISDLESELPLPNTDIPIDENYELDIELLYLMKENNMPLTSLNKLKLFPKYKKQEYINKLKKKLKYKTEEKVNNDKQCEVFDIMDQLTKYGSVKDFKIKNNQINQSLIVNNASIKQETELETQQCLRCLKNINMTNTNSKCKFHALVNDINEYNNLGYFTQRNAELLNAKNFKFACCNRKCKGYFMNCKSQENGCCKTDKHLFYKDNEIDIFDHDIKTDLYKNNNNYNLEGINLCGKWKCFVYIENKTSLHMIRDIVIFKHNKLGNIEGHLIGSTYVENNKYKSNFDNELYCGQIKDNQLLLTYKSKNKYFESFELNIDQYQLYGQFTSTHASGTCQWYKIQKII